MTTSTLPTAAELDTARAVIDALLEWNNNDDGQMTRAGRRVVEAIGVYATAKEIS